jgi:hypothetical protein
MGRGTYVGDDPGRAELAEGIAQAVDALQGSPVPAVARVTITPDPAERGDNSD